MKYFRVVYQVPGTHDKQWTVAQGPSREHLHSQFAGVVVVRLEEISKEEFLDNYEEY